MNLIIYNLVGYIIFGTGNADTGRHPYFPVSENSEVFVADGDHIGLKCVPEGNPKPQVTWHLPGNLTINSPVVKSHVSFHYENVELEIQNMVRELHGSYVCLAHNSIGTSSYTYIVKYGRITSKAPVLITTPPIIPMRIKPDVFLKYTEHNVTEGDSILAIPCAADGIPNPKITWSAIGSNMPSNAIQYQQFLIIRNIRLDDSRYYLCTATNSEGHASKPVHIIVHPKPHVKPTVTLPPSLQGTYGTTITLTCNVTGYPTPTIKWYFNGKSLSTKTNKYEIQNATLAEMGAYTCEATNDAGTSRTDAVFIVHGTAPSLTTTPPQSVMATPNNPPSFTCRASGDPTPTITWEFKPFVGTTSSTYHAKLSPDHTTLTLPNITKSGLVTCTASNPFGRVQASSSVIYTPAVSMVG
ncbi:immunoglobulin superfamily member 10-like [Mytilus galloprovincialis]|uniref:immunoglobulin superfamily member 10-like n=1 Tax=Mytilus galloprovincialis TaxID=29158 RepID=UPI003F7BA343